MKISKILYYMCRVSRVTAPGIYSLREEFQTQSIESELVKSHIDLVLRGSAGHRHNTAQVEFGHHTIPIIEKLRTYSIIYQDISYLEFYRHVLEKCWNYRYDNILATGRKHFQKCFVNQPLSLTKIIMKHGIKSRSSQLSITICIRMFGSMRVQMCFTVKRSNEIMNCTKLNNVVLKQIFIHFSVYELSNDCLFTYLADTE